jgi:hypothetical protein
MRRSTDTGRGDAPTWGKRAEWTLDRDPSREGRPSPAAGVERVRDAVPPGTHGRED